MAEIPEQKVLPFLIRSAERLVEVPGHGSRLVAAFQVQAPGNIPLSHMIEIPGELLPLLIEAAQAIIDQYPAQTTGVLAQTRRMTAEEIEAALQQATPSGIVDPTGKPIDNGKSKLKLVN